MPPSGSTFTDWQQVDRERPLLIDEDFSWSEPPSRPRRRITGDTRRPSRVDGRQPGRLDNRRTAGGDPRGHRVGVAEPELAAESSTGAEPLSGAESLAGAQSVAALDQPTQIHSHFDEMMDEWNHERARTVVITGRGDERYMPPARRRSRSSDLRFHERAGFNPDRTAMWAVLLGLVLLIACIAH